MTTDEACQVVLDDQYRLHRADADASQVSRLADAYENISQHKDDFDITITTGYDDMDQQISQLAKDMRHSKTIDDDGYAYVGKLCFGGRR
ncbi:hypothetical protein F8O07_06940 [Pseudoclavibacter sp. CFCC 13796]|uniref:hypothetical protein n=1 Tax=Pseudoclavibacter sp. CFCC 13796 TaxID=2615179 RepID=UPI0013014716|nr:hypothetical protein [Pseudoclavibacter sp. CFCC 13796]KAB1661635.1 hypothetical protein F8O07_06940 [Pseudoclavibacter sp. CFCC 13796]